MTIKCFTPLCLENTKNWPIVEGAGSQQQPTRDRNLLTFFSFREAAGEVDEQNDKERNIPKIKLKTDFCKLKFGHRKIPVKYKS